MTAPTAPSPAAVADLACAREAQHAEEEARLRERLRALEEEHRRLCDDYVDAMAQVSELASLCAALERLHGTLDREEVLTAVQEIVVNLVGSEELAVYEPLPGEDALRRTACFGVEGRTPLRIAAGEGPVGAAARAAVARVGEAGRADGEPTACVPLLAGAEVVGVVAVYGLLAHKPRLAALDGRLLDVLSRQAGAALYLTSLHARRGA